MWFDFFLAWSVYMLLGYGYWRRLASGQMVQVYIFFSTGNAFVDCYLYQHKYTFPVLDHHHRCSSIIQCSSSISSADMLSTKHPMSFCSNKRGHVYVLLKITLSTRKIVGNLRSLTHVTIIFKIIGSKKSVPKWRTLV